MLVFTWNLDSKNCCIHRGWFLPLFWIHGNIVYTNFPLPAYCVVELFGGKACYQPGYPSISYIRVDFDGRCWEDSEARSACKTGLAPAPPHTPATAPAPAPVLYTIHCQQTQGEALPWGGVGDPVASSSHHSGIRLFHFFLLLLLICRANGPTAETLSKFRCYQKQLFLVPLFYRLQFEVKT